MYDMSFEEFDNEYYEVMEWAYACMTDEEFLEELVSIELADLEEISFDYGEMEEIPFC